MFERGVCDPSEGISDQLLGQAKEGTFYDCDCFQLYSTDYQLRRFFLEILPAR